MRVDVLCSDPQHPVVPHLRSWLERQSAAHDVTLVHARSELSSGDVLFLVSCHEIIRAEDRANYRQVMVLHASDLPAGRGWSPHIWDILAGSEQITMSLLDAEDEVDSGAVWAKASAPVSRDMLHDEINAVVFALELELMDRGLELLQAGASPTPQPAEGTSYHRRRRPEDSEIDPQSPLIEVFDLLRVADPDRYPAFFRLHGHEYEILLRKRRRD